MALVSFSTEIVEPFLPREEVQSVIERLSSTAQGVFDGHLLERALERLSELEQSEIALNREISDLRKEASELSIAMNLLEPIEIAGRLDRLGQEIFSLAEPSTVVLQEDLGGLKERFETLCFRFAFPDAEELRQDSFQNNLRFRLEQRIANSGPKTAAVLKSSLRSLESQCRAAEEIFRGKGPASYLALPKEVRADVEGRLFEKVPDVSIESLLSDPKNQNLVAAAIMAAFGDRMMDDEFACREKG